MVDDFVDRKHGQAPVTYYDDRLKPILEETYGAIVYQEQVMRISMDDGGLLGGQGRQAAQGHGQEAARRARRARRPTGSRAPRPTATTRKLAERMWDDILPFAEYAFNKSHSAAYGLLTMQTAYLKAHYPLEYMAAVLTSYTGKTDDIVKYVAECNRAGMTVLPPDVNSSGKDFTAVPARASASGSPASAASARASSTSIVEARESGGPFTSLHDFCDRVDMTPDEQEDARGAHQGRRVRLDRLHAQAPDVR